MQSLPEASAAIGEAIAHKPACEGTRLDVSGLPTNPIHDVTQAITSAGDPVEPHLGELADELRARACGELALQCFGSLDVPVNNAGVFIANAETNVYRIADFDRAVRNNIRTARCAQS